MAIYTEIFRPEATNVLVSGAVTVPGLVPLRNTERNLLFAIVAAGGVSELASGKVTLKRLRCPEKQITLNLAEPKDMKKALALPALENGDMVTVHAAVPNLVFVGGLVNAPQAQAYPPGAEITILQALAASGGPRTDLTVREATLIRRMPDGKDIHVKLDISRIQSGRDPNLTLAAGDILWLPFTVETYTEDWINQHFYLRAGAVANVNYNVSGVEYMNRRAQQSQGYSNSDGLQDQYDPLGFLNRNAALQNLVARPAKGR
jgi:protein involved in polysaccharide export with SLBB domain